MVSRTEIKKGNDSQPCMRDRASGQQGHTGGANGCWLAVGGRTYSQHACHTSLTKRLAVFKWIKPSFSIAIPASETSAFRSFHEAADCVLRSKGHSEEKLGST